jgi:hypothetical protein
MLKMERTIGGPLRVYGLKMGDVRRYKIAEQVAELVALVPALALAIDPLLIARNTMRQQKSRFDYALEKSARADEICPRVMTVPGVEPITADHVRDLGQLGLLSLKILMMLWACVSVGAVTGRE